VYYVARRLPGFGWDIEGAALHSGFGV